MLSITDPKVTPKMREAALRAADTFQPIHDRILILPIPADTRIGNIIIPEVAQSRAQFGYIIAMGEGMIDANGNILCPRVRIGLKVMFAKNAGSDIAIDGQDFFLLRETDIYGIEYHSAAEERFFPAQHRLTEPNPNPIRPGRRKAAESFDPNYTTHIRPDGGRATQDTSL